MPDKSPDIVEQTTATPEIQTKEPPMYKVVLFNDDFTTKEFVVEILVVIYHKGAAEATELMWRIHRQGKGVAGVYPLDIAETKVAATIDLAHENGFPLKVSLEHDGPS
jgi:ATP-dependent Clp protease adaptor protein ClpS